MQATMIQDEYSDICLGYPYEVDRVYADGHIRLKNGPRRYDGRCFEIQHKGKKINLKEAYRRYLFEKVKRRSGIK
ncbi:MAG: hypothetical protein UFG06_13895 [Lachnospiraceae bacterium]|nr:hypothetical protein [Lachnospiraceae bacterium]